MKRILITGPESTGKSELADALARHYGVSCVPEYARDMWKILGGHMIMEMWSILPVCRLGNMTVSHECKRMGIFRYLADYYQGMV